MIVDSPNKTRFREDFQSGRSGECVHESFQVKPGKSVGTSESTSWISRPLRPRAEQHQIVAEVEARITAIDHLEAELNRQITRSDRLRQSLWLQLIQDNWKNE